MATREAQLFHTECDTATVSLSDDTTTVFDGPCIVYGVYVDTVLSAQVCPIQDGSTAVITLPASSAAGDNFDFPGIRFDTSLVVNPDDSASGVIRIDFRKVNPDNVFTLANDVNLVLHYNFAEDQSLVSRLGPTLDITRTTDATFFDTSGILQTAASGVARFDHNPVTRVPLGLLVEEARTNLAVRSEAFNLAWTNTKSVDTQNEGTAPDGNNTLNKIIDDGSTGNDQVFIFQAETVENSAAYTFSVFAKKDQLNWLRLAAVAFTTPANSNAWFDLGNGVVGTKNPGFSSSGIEDVGNGIFRCHVVFTTDGVDTSGVIRIAVADQDNDATVDVDGTSSIFPWGTKLEKGAFSTSYIKTEGSTVTKNKDDVSTGDVSGFSITENTVYTKFRTGNIGQDTTVWSLHDGTANERIAVEITGGNIHFIGVDGSVTQWDINTAITADAEHQVAVAWKANDIAFYLDGTQVGVDSGATLPTFTTLNICSDHSDAEHINSTMDEFRDYNVRRPNQFLEDLSNGLIDA